MAVDNLFDDIQGCVDSIAHAVGACAAEECSVAEMWSVIDEQCHKLAQLSSGHVLSDDEDDDEDVDEFDDDTQPELNFDEEDGGEHANDDEDDAS